MMSLNLSFGNPETENLEVRPARAASADDRTQVNVFGECNWILERIRERPGGSVLEIGCCTARNLRVLDKQAPQHSLYGLEASLSHLANARDRLERSGCTRRITLAQGRARDLNPRTHFGMEEPFDVIFFSSVLSSIPAWPAALGAALSHLDRNGCLYLIDTWEPEGRSSAVQTVLRHWLGYAPANSDPEVLTTLRKLEMAGRVSCSVTSGDASNAVRAAVKSVSTSREVPAATAARRNWHGKPSPADDHREVVSLKEQVPRHGPSRPTAGS